MQPKPPVKDCIEQYKSYVDQFVDQVLPAMPAGSPLSFDHYPAFDVPGDGSYDNYSAAGAGGSRACWWCWLQPSINLSDGVSAIAAVKDEGGYGLRISARLAGEGEKAELALDFDIHQLVEELQSELRLA